jgi:hypothetical protein
MSPAEARGRLRYLNMSAGGKYSPLPRFAELVEIPVCKLKPYFDGKPMSVEQLGHLADMIRAKGFAVKERV